MNNLRLITILSAVACVAGLRVADAQTAANITVFSGNGQVICQCPNSGATIFLPLQVLVTDAAGNPVPNNTVTWNLTSGSAGAALLNTSTVTDANGIAFTNLLPGNSIFSGSLGAQPGQNIVTATATGPANPTVTFTETQAFTTQGTYTILTDNSNLPIAGTTVTATAGSSGFTNNGVKQTSFRVQVTSLGAGPLAGVSVRLVSNQSSPSVACATGAGADPGSVLTDSTGVATCTPIFSGSGGGSFYVEIGGVAPADPTQPSAYFKYPAAGFINMVVTAAVPTSLSITSGNNQSANAGQSVSLPLVVTVSGSGGALSGQTVNWTVSPSGSAALSNSTSTTDLNGQARTTVTLASGAAGTVTVSAKIAGSNIASQNFTITAVPLVSVSGLSIVSGNNQTVLANGNFANPLVVQVTGSNGTPLANVPVTFTVSSGTATVSQSSVTTGANGQASVTVAAGNGVGNVTVLASANGISQTFNLTISPPGPALSTATYANAADQQRNSLSPCSLATVTASGLAPSLLGVSPTPIVGPLPTTWSNDSVSISGKFAPIQSVSNQNGQQQLTFQVPCDIQAGSNPITVNVGAGSATSTLTIQPASPGIFQTVMSDGVTRAVLVRPDGTFVSLQNPARRGEHIIAYVTGLGPTTPSVSTNSLPIPGQSSNVNYNVIVGVNNAGVPLDYARLSEDLIGVYVVSFQIPNDAPVNNNVVFSIGVAPQGSGTVYYSSGSSIPIA